MATYNTKSSQELQEMSLNTNELVSIKLKYPIEHTVESTMQTIIVDEISFQRIKGESVIFNMFDIMNHYQTMSKELELILLNINGIINDNNTTDLQKAVGLLEYGRTEYVQERRKELKAYERELNDILKSIYFPSPQETRTYKLAIDKKTNHPLNHYDFEKLDYFDIYNILTILKKKISEEPDGQILD